MHRTSAAVTFTLSICAFHFFGHTAIEAAHSGPIPSGQLAIQVIGNRFAGADGGDLQLRGVAYGKSAFSYIDGLSSTDAFGGLPLLDASVAWRANVWRLSLNEASWLNLRCVDTANVEHLADPGPAHGAPSYRQQILEEVDRITAARMYTILVLHWAAPDNHCPMTQTQMADADHSLDFWRSVATTFKDNPAVLFELYNEPYDAWLGNGQRGPAVIAKGGTFYGYPAQPGYKLVTKPWKVASMQDMITAVRSVGARNVVLVGTNGWDDDLSDWLENVPTDPMRQMAATWHPYPPIQQVRSASPDHGGSGYGINDTITLSSPNPGSGVYVPAIFKVTAIRNGAVTETSIVNPGRYLATRLPSGPIPQGSTSGTGRGASFDVRFQWASGGGSMPSNWPTALQIAARYPLIITETGDHNQPGTVDAPWLSTLLPWADRNGFSYVGWWFEASGEPDYVLIKDNHGTPSDGYGQYYRAHLLCRANGLPNCP